MRTLRLLICAAVLAVAVAACGSSSKSKALSASAYRTKVDALCSANNKRLNTKPPKGEAFQTEVETEQKETLQTLNAIKALTPPASLQAQVSSWTATLDKEAAISKKATDDLLNKQIKQSEAELKQNGTLAKTGHAQAKALGLTVCSG